ncbi:MAG TPA: hypothetical protein VHE78_05140 [Gemmatimonadaceae bacterium]|nr:hypothetical protein [Gemmatimonadaceae bacterium]
MSEFFPRNTLTWKIEEPRFLRRISLSLPYMGLITGVAMRLWRSYVLTHGVPDSWLWVGGTFLAGMVFLFLMATLHLGNYTLRNWAWRAPAFAVLESGAEIVTSLALTTVALEPLGANTAELSDWLPTAVRILFWRALGVSFFALVLALVVSIVRRLLLAAEDRTSTAVRIHRASLEREAFADDKPSDK